MCWVWGLSRTPPRIIMYLDHVYIVCHPFSSSTQLGICKPPCKLDGITICLYTSHHTLRTPNHFELSHKNSQRSGDTTHLAVNISEKNILPVEENIKRLENYLTVIFLVIIPPSVHPLFCLGWPGFYKDFLHRKLVYNLLFLLPNI